MKPIIILLLLTSCTAPSPWYEGEFVLPGKHPLNKEIHVQIHEHVTVNGIDYGPPSVYGNAVGALDGNSGLTMLREGLFLTYVDKRGVVFKGEVKRIR